MGRVIPGLLLAGGWLLLLLSGSNGLFYIFIFLTLLLAADEYVRLVFHSSSSECLLTQRIFFIFVILLPALSVAFSDGRSFTDAALLVSLLLLSLNGVLSAGHAAPAETLRLLCHLFFGVFYVGVLSSHILLLYTLPEGASWILIATSITAGSDSGAWFCGRKWGRHRLCPYVSPKKTVEGAVGGILCAVFTSLCFGAVVLSSPNYLLLGFLALLLSLVGILGDLCESVLKRGCGIKDSGTILGEHGGILDRIDSLLFAVPVLYWVLVVSPSLI